MVVGGETRSVLPWLDAPLREALARQRGHALLVQAPEGIGTWSFLRLMAQAWLCEDPGDAPPCGRCASCRLVGAEAHPDLYLLLPESRRVGLTGGEGAAEAGADTGRTKKKPSRQIRIDEVRAAVDWIVHSSSRGRAKVLVVHPAEAMNLQASSALLKSLEEPPGMARWLLGTADAAHLLPTVRSRCQRLVLPAPDAASGQAWLEAQGVADAAVLLAAAGGRPLEARELVAAGIDARTWIALPAAVARGHAAAMPEWALPRTIDTLQKLCHDAQAVAAGGRPRYFPLEAIAPGARLPALVQWGRTLSRISRHDEHPWNEGLLVEALVAEGHACWQDATTAPPSTRRPLDTLAR